MADAKDGKDPSKRPIIVKKIKKGGGGHHGGAWKVAYADFVTAMMAFFLLLWLLSTSSKATLEGIAEYFTPTTGVKDSQGIGFKGGLGDVMVGVGKPMSQPGLVSGAAPMGEVPDNQDRPSPEDAKKDDNLFEEGATAVTQAVAQDKTLQAYRDNLRLEQTAEGLRISVSDSDKMSMFETGKATLTPEGEKILARLAPIVQRMPNYLALTGNTDGSPAELGRAGYTNWELSTDRAQTARRFLEKEGVEPERTKRVVGMADRELIVPAEPRNPRNRRIVLLMLRGEHMMIPDGAVPEAAPAPEPILPTGPANPAKLPPKPGEEKEGGGGH
jgi:chemotaxis protein MotB